MTNTSSSDTPSSTFPSHFCHFSPFFPLFQPTNCQRFDCLAGVAKSKLIFHLENIPEMSFVHLFLTCCFVFHSRRGPLHCIKWKMFGISPWEMTQLSRSLRFVEVAFIWITSQGNILLDSLCKMIPEGYEWRAEQEQKVLLKYGATIWGWSCLDGFEFSSQIRFVLMSPQTQYILKEVEHENKESEVARKFC